MTPDSHPMPSPENASSLIVLLRKLAVVQSDSEHKTICESLQELTGADGKCLGDWLNWLLHDCVGVSNPLAALQHHADHNPDPVSTEQFFDKPEYNWCALERITSPEDMQKLRDLYVDFETPIPTDCAGPLSFRRLTMVGESELAFFRGKSISEALFSSEVTPEHLRALKEYGKMMMMPVFPPSTQRAGAILYAAAISQALVRFERKITSLSPKDLAESLPGLLQRNYIVDRYLTLFREALGRCT